VKIKIFFHKDVDTETREIVQEAIDSTFRLEVEQSDLPIDINKSYSKSRMQYNAEKILEEVMKIANMFLVIVPFDIYVPGLNFVFGVALPQRGAVIGISRLRYGVDNIKYAERLRKTIKHELGHVFGLSHCRNPCVMRFANSLYELDEKPSDFCAKCRNILRNKINIDR